MAVNLKQKGHKVISGQKLCRHCINQYEKTMKEPEEITIDENETEKEEELHTEEGVEYEESPTKKLNTSLESVGVLSITFHAVPQHSQVNRAKDKLKSVMEKYQKSISDVYNIPTDEIKDKPKYNVSSETTKKAGELEKLNIVMTEK